MNLSSKEITELEAWWAGELSEEQAEALKKRLARDATFKNAAENWKQIVMNGFAPTQEELVQRQTIRQQLEAFESEAQPMKQKSSMRLKWLYISGGVAAVLLLLVWFVFTNPFSPLKSELAPLFTHLEREAHLGAGVPEGDQLYDQKKYREAWPLLIQEIRTPNDSLNLLYAGVAALGAGKSEAAAPLFEELLISGQWSNYEPAIKWYLALAYAENKEPEKAKPLLNELANTENTYASRAQEALSLLHE